METFVPKRKPSVFVCPVGLNIIDFASVCCPTVCVCARVCVYLKRELVHISGLQYKRLLLQQLWGF